MPGIEPGPPAWLAVTLTNRLEAHVHKITMYLFFYMALGLKDFEAGNIHYLCPGFRIRIRIRIGSGSVFVGATDSGSESVIGIRIRIQVFNFAWYFLWKTNFFYKKFLSLKMVKIPKNGFKIYKKNLMQKITLKIRIRIRIQKNLRMLDPDTDPYIMYTDPKPCHPSNGPRNGYCPLQNHYLPRHINRYINSYYI